MITRTVRHSGIQREVLHLYADFLRFARRRPEQREEMTKYAICHIHLLYLFVFLADWWRIHSKRKQSPLIWGMCRSSSPFWAEEGSNWRPFSSLEQKGSPASPPSPPPAPSNPPPSPLSLHIYYIYLFNLYSAFLHLLSTAHLPIHNFVPRRLKVYFPIISPLKYGYL